MALTLSAANVSWLAAGIVGKPILASALMALLQDHWQASSSSYFDLKSLQGTKSNIRVACRAKPRRDWTRLF